MKRQSGNVIFYVLLGIALVGFLTVVLRRSDGGREDIDTEDLLLKATQVEKHASEVARAVATLLGEQVSEVDLRFAPPDDNSTAYGDITTTPSNQIFGTSGGKVTYRSAPDGIQTAVAPWEFFATSRIPQVGSDRAELIAVLPNVTQTFCDTINHHLGFAAGTMPTDVVTGSTPDCVKGAAANRFAGTFNDTTPNTLDSATFSKLPALQACVKCASDNSYNYYYVLMAR